MSPVQVAAETVSQAESWCTDCQIDVAVQNGLCRCCAGICDHGHPDE